MSNDNLFNTEPQSENTQKQDFIDPVSDYVSTDVITDLKTGIYNLFLSLLEHLIVLHGPVDAVKISTRFLDDISDTFKKTTDQKENN